MNGYQLLNEVGNGGTLSSLFTILSLFTEDVKISWQDDDPSEGLTESPIDTFTFRPVKSRSQRADSDVSQLQLDSKFSMGTSVSSSASTVHRMDSGSGPGSPSTYSTASESRTPRVPYFPLSRSATIRPTRVHHGVVARATEDTTLAVIPAEAFRRVTKNFPKATGHIVQGASFCLRDHQHLTVDTMFHSYPDTIFTSYIQCRP
jgi:lysophospholipid hydrolase